MNYFRQAMTIEEIKEAFDKAFKKALQSETNEETDN